MYTILVVEDEKQIQKGICNFLEREGFKTRFADDGEQALHEFKQGEIDLVLLDMMLPKISGEAVLKQIRVDSDIPIIIISALSDELIQIDAFEQKVDDYVVKPFSMNILLYKIKGLLRRASKRSVEEVKYERLCLEVDNYYLSYDGKEIKLTATEFDIVQLLLTNLGRVFSREEILTIVWGYDYFGDSRNIDVHIKNLRKKIPLDCIVTVKRVGYKIDRLSQ